MAILSGSDALPRTGGMSTVAILAQGTPSGWSVSLAFLTWVRFPVGVFLSLSPICGPHNGSSTARPARRKTQIRGTDEERKVVSCSSNSCCGELLSMDSSLLRLAIDSCVTEGCWYSVWGSVLLAAVEWVNSSDRNFRLNRFGDSMKKLRVCICTLGVFLFRTSCVLQFPTVA